VLGAAACLVLELRFNHLGGILAGRYRMLAVLAGWWVAFGVAAWGALRLPRRAVGAVVLAGSVLFFAAGITRGPQLSDDLYRYAWDGAVQAHGIDPYRYPPDDPHLSSLRDPWLWPGPATCARLGKPVTCTRVNRAGDRTIYPPAAQAWFVGLRAVLPADSRDLGYQVAHGLVGVGLTGLLLLALARLGRNPGWAVLWAWSPLAVIETAMDAHVDVVAAAAVVAALWALERRREAGGGALLGLAVAVKLIPGVVLPAGIRRGPVRVVAAAAAVVAVSYLPHVVAVGPRVLGYLPGYLREENYAAGSRFLLLGLLGLHGTVAQAAAGVLLAGAAVVVALRREPASVITRARWMLVAVFLVVTPVQPWYGVLLVAVGAFDGAWEPLAVAAAAYPLYFGTILESSAPGYGQLSYGAAAVVLAATAVWHRHLATAREGRPPGGGPPSVGVRGPGT
jgi:hypothetical protein